MSKEYRKRIIVDSKIHFGKPCVAGTRIPVENVLELVKEGIPFKKIIEDYYPDLKIEDIKACISPPMKICLTQQEKLVGCS